jgi:hypothetical protein
MAGICDRCSEKSSQLINISIVPELRPIMHLGYRNVCPECYDDLLVEAKNAGSLAEGESESAVVVSIKATVSGNTSHLEAFQDETVVEEITAVGLTFATSRELDSGAILEVAVPSYGLEFTAIVEDVWQEGDQNVVDLKLVEPSEGWDKLWQDYSADGGQ